jgi:hypothetical protein
MKESIVDSFLKEVGGSTSAFLTMLPYLLNSLCERMPPDTPHILHVEFSLKREAESNQIVVERLDFGRM